MYRTQRFGSFSLLISAALLGLALGVAHTASIIYVEPEERVRGAEQIVVGQVESTSASMETNAWGDQLIVTHARIKVEDTLKGSPVSTLEMDIEGGTINGLTLHVSDMPVLRGGERAVFLLKKNARGRKVPFPRGLGVLGIDKEDRLPAVRMSLDEFRKMSRKNEK